MRVARGQPTSRPSGTHLPYITKLMDAERRPCAMSVQRLPEAMFVCVCPRVRTCVCIFECLLLYQRAFFSSDYLFEL